MKNKTYRHSLQPPVEIPNAGYLNSLRLAAFHRFKETGFPTRKLEGWKYLHLDPLLETAFSAPLPEKTPPDLSKFALGKNEHRLVFQNGLFQPQQSAGSGAGFTLCSLSEACASGAEGVKLFLGKTFEKETNPFALINTFKFEDGVYLHIGRDVVVEKPIHLLFFSNTNEGSPMAFYPRILIILESGAKAEVILNQSGKGGACLVNTTAEIYLQRDAKLSLLSIQREGGGSAEFFSVRAEQKEGSSLTMNSFFHGGAIRRDDVEIALRGENAFSSVSGLAVLSGASQAFENILINHEVPGCTSRQLFKNILAGKSSADFNSTVHVFRGAQHSNSQQIDRNLLLSDHARAYSRPQLKIDADDVQCNHGAATGRIGEEDLFYLRSRGIRAREAKNILTLAFAQEILDQISQPVLRTQLETLVREQIDQMIGDETK